MKRILLSAFVAVIAALASLAGTVTDVLTLDNLVNDEGKTPTTVYNELTAAGNKWGNVAKFFTYTSDASGVKYQIGVVYFMDGSVPTMKFTGVNGYNTGVIVTEAPENANCTNIQMDINSVVGTASIQRGLHIFTQDTPYNDLTAICKSYYSYFTVVEPGTEVVSYKPMEKEIINFNEIEGWNTVATKRYVSLFPKPGSVCATSISFMWQNGDASTDELAAPEFDKETGSYPGEVTVAMTAPDGASIYYTTDGTVPTAESTLYTAPVTLTQTTTLKAIAIKGDQTSAVTSATYTILPSYSSLAAVLAAPPSGEAVMNFPLTVYFRGTSKTGASGSQYFYVEEGANRVEVYVAEATFTSNLAVKTGAVINGGWRGTVQTMNDGRHILRPVNGTTFNVATEPATVASPMMVNDMSVLSDPANNLKVVTLTNVNVLNQVRQKDFVGYHLGQAVNFSNEGKVLMNQMGEYEITGILLQQNGTYVIVIDGTDQFSYQGQMSFDNYEELEEQLQGMGTMAKFTVNFPITLTYVYNGGSYYGYLAFFKAGDNYGALAIRDENSYKQGDMLTPGWTCTWTQKAVVGTTYERVLWLSETTGVQVTAGTYAFPIIDSVLGLDSCQRYQPVALSNVKFAEDLKVGYDEQNYQSYNERFTGQLCNDVECGNVNFFDFVQSTDVVDLVANKGYGVYGIVEKDPDNNEATIVLPLSFTNPIVSGISGTVADGMEDGMEIYDLQGRRVMHAAPGIYVIRNGGKTYKTVIK